MNNVVILVYAMFAFGALPVRADPFVVTFYATFTPHPVSPEGFVDESDKGLVDSVADLRKVMDGGVWNPHKGVGSRTRYVAVTDPAKADIVLAIAARGTSSTLFGQRTTMLVYKGVVLADTVPTVAVTRWVSMILSVGSYRKEFVAWSASAGAWTLDADLLADLVADWVMANQAQILRARPKR